MIILGDRVKDIYTGRVSIVIGRRWGSNHDEILG